MNKHNSQSKANSQRKCFLRRFVKGFFAFVLFSVVLAGFTWIEIEGVLMKELASTKEKIKNSPNFKNGIAQNKQSTTLMTEDTKNTKNDQFNSDDYNRYKTILDLLKVPKVRIPSIKSDLKAPQKDSFVWLGHSSYMLWLDGKSILIDPILQDNAAPVPLIIKAFDGADIYTPEDLPNIDFLIITHNHYDHLSKKL